MPVTLTPSFITTSVESELVIVFVTRLGAVNSPVILTPSLINICDESVEDIVEPSTVIPSITTEPPELVNVKFAFEGDEIVDPVTDRSPISRAST